MTKVHIHLTLWSNQPNIYSYLKSDCMSFHVICAPPTPNTHLPPAPPRPLRARTCGILFRFIYKNCSRAKFISGRSLIHLNTSSVLIYPYNAGHFTFKSSLGKVKLNGQQTHSKGNGELLVIMTVITLTWRYTHKHLRARGALHYQQPLPLDNPNQLK